MALQGTLQVTLQLWLQQNEAWVKRLQLWPSRLLWDIFTIWKCSITNSDMIWYSMWFWRKSEAASTLQVRFAFSALQQSKLEKWSVTWSVTWSIPWSAIVDRPYCPWRWTNTGYMSPTSTPESLDRVICWCPPCCGCPCKSVGGRKKGASTTMSSFLSWFLI